MATLEIRQDEAQIVAPPSADTILPPQTHEDIRAARLAGLQALRAAGVPNLRSHEAQGVQVAAAANQAPSQIVSQVSEQRGKPL
jgi:hypothetical protein